MNNICDESKIVKAVNEIFHDIESIDYEKRHPEIMIGQKDWWDNFSNRYIKNKTEKNRILLDIATGTGFIPNILSKDLNSEDKVIGYELSLEMLKRAKSKIKSNNIYLIQGDVEKLPFKNKSVDILTINSALHHFPNLIDSLKEIDRVIKNGGLLVAGREPNHHFYNSFFIKILSRAYYVLWGTKITDGMRREINKKLREKALIEEDLSKEEIIGYVEYNSIPEHRDYKSTDKSFSPESIIKFFSNYELLEYSTTSTFIYRSAFPFKNLFNKIINRIFKNKGSMFTILLRKK